MARVKIPINDTGEGNYCPKCGSTKIDICYQFPLIVYHDKKTNKERFYNYENGKKKYKARPSYRELVQRYKMLKRMKAKLRIICVGNVIGKVKQ